MTTSHIGHRLAWRLRSTWDRGVSPPHTQDILIGCSLVALSLLLLAIRLISPNVEIDEAHFFDQRHWAWGYEGSQPPLYTWLVNAVIVIGGGAFVPAVAGVKFTLNAITWILLYRLVADVAGRREPALLAVATFALMPQVIWQAQVTLAHSVLVLTGSVGVLYALHLAMTRGSWSAYLLLGVAAAVGVLAKYSFGVFLATAIAAAASLPEVRRSLSGRKLAVSLAVLVLLCAPHLVWAVEHWEATTERMQRIYTPSRAPDVPGIGLNGFLWLLYALLTSTGPAWLVWLISLGPRQFRNAWANPPPGCDSRRRAVRLWERMLVIGLAVTAAAVLVADVHKVEARYLIPLLVPFAPWMALRFWTEDRAPDSTRHVRRVGLVLLMVLPLAYALKTTSGDDRLTMPYPAVASEIANRFGHDVTIDARRPVTEVNVALHLGQNGRQHSVPRLVLVIEQPHDAVWWGDGRTSNLLRCGYRPLGPAVDIHREHGFLARTVSHITIQAFDPPSNRTTAC